MVKKGEKMTAIQQFIQNAEPYWRAYTEHLFVQKMADGSLPKSSFQHYLKQDYLYLYQYCRALSLGIYKAENFDQMRYALDATQAILNEVELHLQFCREWGIEEQEVRKTPESSACVAYTRYVLDCGMRGGLAELFTAIAPCAIGYAEIGKKLADSAVENTPYQAWIDTYAAPEYQAAVAKLADYLNQLCENLPAEHLAKLQEIFTTATRMEVEFWQMGLDQTI
ncbi:thiaminase II [Actinobacillus lignieresii]|uniref:thiaminase II n=1 Tax=Actinobacillus lignieresii TaxID=720 RepID=UPI000E200E0C|nr:thiaminase II [Actinobacillus lignieresii]